MAYKLSANKQWFPTRFGWGQSQGPISIFSEASQLAKTGSPSAYISLSYFTQCNSILVLIKRLICGVASPNKVIIPYLKISSWPISCKWDKVRCKVCWKAQLFQLWELFQNNMMAATQTVNFKNENLKRCVTKAKLARYNFSDTDMVQQHTSSKTHHY